MRHDIRGFGNFIDAQIGFPVILAQLMICDVIRKDQAGVCPVLRGIER
jgi:hypothetical protein